MVFSAWGKSVFYKAVRILYPYQNLSLIHIYFFFLHKPVCKILDERAKTVNKDMDDAQKARNRRHRNGSRHRAANGDVIGMA